MVAAARRRACGMGLQVERSKQAVHLRHNKPHTKALTGVDIPTYSALLDLESGSAGSPLSP